MRNAIQEQVDAINKVVAEQENRIVSELNSGFDTQNAAMLAFATSMRQVRTLRDQADKLESEALRTFDTACTNSQALKIGIISQIQDGRMVTGSDQPSLRRNKPKLVSGVEGGAP